MCLQVKNVPIKFTSNILWKFSIVLSSKVVSIAIPALFTSTSNFPNLLTASSINFSQSSTFETSVGTAKTFPPSSSISFATLSNASFLSLFNISTKLL